MKKAAVKDQLCGGITEMMSNRAFFYKSEIGKNHEYSHWTDEGRKELMEFVENMSRKMLAAEDAELDQRAKDMVIKNLKDKE